MSAAFLTAVSSAPNIAPVACAQPPVWSRGALAFRSATHTCVVDRSVVGPRFTRTAPNIETRLISTLRVKDKIKTRRLFCSNRQSRKYVD